MFNTGTPFLLILEVGAHHTQHFVCETTLLTEDGIVALSSKINDSEGNVPHNELTNAIQQRADVSTSISSHPIKYHQWTATITRQQLITTTQLLHDKFPLPAHHS